MNNYSITQRKLKDSNVTQLVYSGELSFNQIESIYSETDSFIKTHPHIEIIIEEAELLDLSFLQMMISLKKSYPFNIKLNLNDDLKDLIRVSGFYPYLTDEN